MSLLTLTNELEKLISNPKKFKMKRFESTRQTLKKFEFLYSDASLHFSRNLTKKIAEMCNYSSYNDDGGMLMTSEEVLLAWIKSAGKLLKFIAKPRECELFIFVKKYEAAISCA
jgi:hypothetical protein